MRHNRRLNCALIVWGIYEMVKSAFKGKLKKKENHRNVAARVACLAAPIFSMHCPSTTSSANTGKYVEGKLNRIRTHWPNDIPDYAWYAHGNR